ncbi:MAG: HisA/HisF family protein [Methanobacterium sp.]|nr:HisA/HisF family protein [Methanobacterium sp.]
MNEIIPVLDLMSGMAVSGKSGLRNTYKPLDTIFSKTPDPVEISISLKRQGFERIYVADLDAIEGYGSNLEHIKNINHIIPVMLDWGVKDFKSFRFALDYAQQIIVATETLNSWIELEQIFNSFPKERIILSVDVKDSEILSKSMSVSFNQIVSRIEYLHPREIILLDITGVGTLEGYNQEILDNFSGLEDSLIVGGGITPSSINTLGKQGISKFLVGTALHSGRIEL